MKIEINDEEACYLTKVLRNEVLHWEKKLPRLKEQESHLVPVVESTIKLNKELDKKFDSCKKEAFEKVRPSNVRTR